jgi:hypothetical protein
VNFDLSDEQIFLREAARDAFGRVRTVEAAREALEGGALPDLWPTARQAGWAGLLIDEAHGGAGLGAIDAMLVLAEAGRVLASVPLLGHLPATAILDAAAGDGVDAELLGRLASGELRAAYVPARPPDDLYHARLDDPDGNDDEPGWTAEPRRGKQRVAAPTFTSDTRDDTGFAEEVSVTGSVAWVPDAAGADTLVVVGT